MYIANRVCYNNRENEWRSSCFLLANASRPRSFSRPLRGFVLSSMISVQPQCNPELFDAFHRIISICYTFVIIRSNHFCCWNNKQFLYERLSGRKKEASYVDKDLRNEVVVIIIFLAMKFNIKFVFLSYLYF